MNSSYQHEENIEPFKAWKKKMTSYEKCGLALYVEDQENLWYIYNECSKHMTSDIDKFVSFNEIKKEKNVIFDNN